VETRGKGHLERILADLSKKGYEARERT